MRAERHIPSFLSTNNLSDKENKLAVGATSHLRHQRIYSRRRCARTIVSNSQSLGAVTVSTYRHRTLRHKSHTVPYNIQMATDNQETPSATSTTSAPAARTKSFVLPRKLTRPRFRAIDPRAIRAIDASFERVPLSDIQRTLEELGPR